ncbi:hypothetical protein GLOTRDRAFT_126704 [Gloeophyllum trabeum ATCC 11539]|uniref:MARVEL domain-containing protein n=1 Tax=Gloeophyllum trabeum (strain ATCC 11539 / FP-39264 / Madison 617) TaxID=670483 RepID=S7RXV7_GLOTA|nr:uncharacterized protein GLOTRDRAFT_126704 [Gloeophyllum trabeum ATCC 11539]EPQ58214.1 hypothetical protein GLOTRDRAFT_126704 [Gloeophyllum trabeum ATCC 11539]
MATIRNPFVVARCVFFAMIIYLNVIALILAALDTGILVHHDLHVPGAPVFIIINSCALSFFSFFAFAELFAANARTAQIKFECAWTVILSIMQLAASIDATVNGPPVFCRMDTSKWAVCASSSILVPTTWLACGALLSYCLLLIGVTVAHYREHSAIWSASVYQVPWFQSKPTNMARLILPSTVKDLPPLPIRTNSDASSFSSRSRYSQSTGLRAARSFATDSEKQESFGPVSFYNMGKNETFDRPAWAKRNETRRGLDAPFVVFRKEREEEETSSTAATEDRPVVATAGSRFLELLQEPKASSRVDKKTGDTKPLAFPQTVYNPDEPIPLPHRSQWVRADQAGKGGK